MFTLHIVLYTVIITLKALIYNNSLNKKTTIIAIIMVVLLTL
jgi:hypothetical protein